MAVIRTSTVNVKVNGVGCSGYLAQPDDDAAHPGVVLIQEWWGIESHIVELAQKMAAEGFVTLVPDHYHGRVVSEPDEAAKEMMMVFDNLELAIKEIGGSIEHLKAMDAVQPKKIGVIGFCMGGLLAYKAAERYPDLGASVPVYGVNYNPTVDDIKNIQAPMLAIYGAEDPFVPQEAIEAIRQTYAAAGKNLTITSYPAGHAFINPDHGNLHAESAEKAWKQAVDFLRANLA